MTTFKNPSLEDPSHQHFTFVLMTDRGSSKCYKLKIIFNLNRKQQRVSCSWQSDGCAVWCRSRLSQSRISSCCCRSRGRSCFCWISRSGAFRGIWRRCLTVRRCAREFLTIRRRASRWRRCRRFCAGSDSCRPTPARWDAWRRSFCSRQVTNERKHIGSLVTTWLSSFHPETARLCDVQPVEMLQDQAQCILSDHVRVRYPRQPTRFGRLLLLLPSLRAIRSTTIEMLFFKETIGNVPISRLLGDMYMMEKYNNNITQNDSNNNTQNSSHNNANNAINSETC